MLSNKRSPSTSNEMKYFMYAQSNTLGIYEYKQPDYIPILSLELNFEIQSFNLSPLNKRLLITSKDTRFIIWDLDFNDFDLFMIKIKQKCDYDGCVHLDFKNQYHPFLMENQIWQADLKDSFKMEYNDEKDNETNEILMSRFIKLGQQVIFFVKDKPRIYQLTVSTKKITYSSKYTIYPNIKHFEITLDESIYIQHYNNEIKICHLQKNETKVIPIKFNIKKIITSLFLPECAAAVLDDGKVLIFYLNGECVWFNEHVSTEVNIHFSLYNKYLLGSVGLDGKIVVYDVIGKKVLRKFDTKEKFTSLSFSSVDNCVLVGNQKGHLLLYDMRNMDVPAWQTDPNELADKVPIHNIAFFNQKSVPVEKQENTFKKMTPNRRSMTISYPNASNILMEKNRPASLYAERSHTTKPNNDGNFELEQPNSIDNNNFNDIFSPIKIKERNRMTPTLQLYSNNVPMSPTIQFNSNSRPSTPTIQINSNNQEVYRQSTPLFNKISLNNNSDNNTNSDNISIDNNIVDSKLSNNINLNLNLNNDKDVNNLPVQLIKNEMAGLIQELKTEFRLSINNLHLDYINQTNSLKQEIKHLADQTNRIPQLLKEIEELKKDNQRIRYKF